jgi:murein L,D-transpeptidase YcbB/YkuD
MRQELAQSRRATIGALEDPTDEEIRAAVQAWKTENADAITAAQELAQEIRQWFRENRPHRPPPEGLHAMHQRRLQFKDNMVQVHDIRQQMEALDPDSDEYAALREQLRELMRDRKRYMRKRRSDEGGVGGDRRPGG